MDEPDDRDARIEILRQALHGLAGYAATELTRALRASRPAWASDEPAVFTKRQMLECVFDAVRQRLSENAQLVELSADEQARLLADLAAHDEEWRPPPPP